MKSARILCIVHPYIKTKIRGRSLKRTQLCLEWMNDWLGDFKYAMIFCRLMMIFGSSSALFWKVNVVSTYLKVFSEISSKNNNQNYDTLTAVWINRNCLGIMMCIWYGIIVSALMTMLISAGIVPAAVCCGIYLAVELFIRMIVSPGGWYQFPVETYRYRQFEIPDW